MPYDGASEEERERLVEAEGEQLGGIGLAGTSWAVGMGSIAPYLIITTHTVFTPMILLYVPGSTIYLEYSKYIIHDDCVDGGVDLVLSVFRRGGTQPHICNPLNPSVPTGWQRAALRPWSGCIAALRPRFYRWH